MAVVIDACTRRVVGWAMADHLRRELVFDALGMALQQRKPAKGLIHHIDHGVQGLRELLSDLVPRLHAYAVDNDITQEEWQRGVDFLTRAGQISTATRQEFVLLSDTLGLSSVVDALTHSRTPDTTPSAVLCSPSDSSGRIMNRRSPCRGRAGGRPVP